MLGALVVEVLGALVVEEVLVAGLVVPEVEVEVELLLVEEVVVVEVVNGCGSMNGAPLAINCQHMY